MPSTAMRSAVPAQEVLQQIAQDVEDATSPGSRGRARVRRNEVVLGALADHLGYSVRRLQVWIFQDFVRARPRLPGEVASSTSLSLIHI